MVAQFDYMVWVMTLLGMVQLKNMLSNARESRSWLVRCWSSDGDVLSVLLRPVDVAV